MLTSEARWQIRRYLEFQGGRLRRLLNQADWLLNSSKNFLELDAQNQARPFAKILSGFFFLSSCAWSDTGPGMWGTPASVEEISSRIRYVPEDRAFLSDRALLPMAACLYLVPSLKKADHLDLLWKSIRLLCRLNLLRELQAPTGFLPTLQDYPYPPTPQGFRRFLAYEHSVLQENILPLPQSLQARVEEALSIYRQYWEEDRAPLQATSLFFPADSFFALDPRMICATPNGGQPRIGLRLRLEQGLSSTEVRDLLKEYRLVFSGGELTSFIILGNPLELQGGGQAGNTSLYLFNIKPSTAIDGRHVHPGPINLVRPQERADVTYYLNNLAKALNVNSNRFWLPWDNERKNFLWVGKPEVSFHPPDWLREGPFTKDYCLTLFGAENLKVWVDNAQDIDLSGPVDGNHVIKQVALPLNMEHRTLSDGSEGIYPRQYDVRLNVLSRCGHVDQTFSTGVTYPLRLSVLAYDVGQTISTGLRSPYPELSHQPASGFYQFNGPKVVQPINPPLIKGKGTWIRILLEHNAPLPYFRNQPPDPTDNNSLQCLLEYEVKNISTGQVVAGGTLADNALGYPGWKVKHEGVLDTEDANRVQNADKVHEDLAIRWGGDGFFYFNFIPPTAGTYRVNCTVRLHPNLGTRPGVLCPSQSLMFELRVVAPSKVKWHWVQVLAEDDWRPVKCVTDEEFDLMEEWLTVLTPSVEFEFHRSESIEYKPPRFHWGRSDSARIVDKVEDLHGDRPGMFMAVMDKGFRNALDESVADWSGAAGYASRAGWMYLKRYDSSTSTGLARMLSNAITAAHEFGHAHPKAYHHYLACDEDPSDPVIPPKYWKPGEQAFYPRATCGEKVFLPREDTTTRLPNWNRLLIYSPEGRFKCYDIMTYCGSKFFELTKTIDLHSNYSELSGE
ncbi:hypothetical protein K8S19_06970 [bacterium]|nr:hypothetical protein [bacterium]